MESSVMTEILTTINGKSEDFPRVVRPKPEEPENPTEIDIYSDEYPQIQIAWRNVILLGIFHSLGFYGLFRLICGQVMVETFFYSWGMAYYTSFGITGGAHRLWSHKSYKAKLPMKIFLAIGQTVAMQNSIWEWSRDHRVHHKYTETLADPHNAKRGFFFSHMGWLMVRKHPAVIMKGKQIDMSDLDADPVVAFQKKHYLWLAPLFCFILPAFIPWYFWGESGVNAVCFAAMFRYIFSLHATWTINSVAHLFGSKPYDRNIGPVESVWSWFSIGEGWHNYHHTFPWDYKAAELGGFDHNLTAFFIDKFAKIGWAYDLKTVPQKIIQQRISRTGDGSHSESQGIEGHHHHAERGPCAWGDIDIPPENVAVTQTLYTRKTK